MGDEFHGGAAYYRERARYFITQGLLTAGTVALDVIQDHAADQVTEYITPSRPTAVTRRSPRFTPRKRARYSPWHINPSAVRWVLGRLGRRRKYRRRGYARS